MLVVQKEGHWNRTFSLCKIAQIHKWTFVEEVEVKVTEPNEKILTEWLQNAGELEKGLITA